MKPTPNNYAHTTFFERECVVSNWASLSCFSMSLWAWPEQPGSSRGHHTRLRQLGWQLHRSTSQIISQCSWSWMQVVWESHSHTRVISSTLLQHNPALWGKEAWAYPAAMECQSEPKGPYLSQKGKVEPPSRSSRSKWIVGISIMVTSHWIAR